VTPQEEQLLEALAERVNSTQLQEKDPDAEALLQKSFGQNPDAVYVLAQTVLVQNIALEQAKTQVTQLQQQVQQARQQPAKATSFLGNLLGHHDAQPAPVQAQPAYGQGQQGFQPVQQVYAPPAQAGYQPVAQPVYQQIPAQGFGGQPSFLRGAVQTAAGVAAGALAFEGVEAALHGIMGHPEFGYGPGFGGVGGFGAPGFGAAGFERPEETVINNYYDQPGPGAENREEHHEQLGQDASGQNLDQNFDDRDLERDSDRGGAQFSDASYETQGDQSNLDDSNLDDSSFDNSGQDDGSGFDDGGGFDGGGGGDNSFV
jgi:uncharacterized protein